MGCESSTVVEVRTHPAPQHHVEVVEEEVIIDEGPPRLRILEATYGPERVDHIVVDHYR